LPIAALERAYAFDAHLCALGEPLLREAGGGTVPSQQGRKA
jgi:hypothetical protein